MTPRARRACWSLATALVFAYAGVAQAHSASNAYLTITGAPGQSVLHAQWDVALRDLEFVLNLDRNGDGNVTWGELRPRQADIARYVYAHFKAGSAGKACVIKPTRQQVDDHADGAYAALFFDIDCGATPTALTLDYTLFFAIDPSHRGIFVLRRGDQTATALLGPDKRRIQLKLAASAAR